VGGEVGVPWETDSTGAGGGSEGLTGASVVGVGVEDVDVPGSGAATVV
jgi:hypothetical protein